VGLLKTSEDINSDTSSKINVVSGDVIDFKIVAQDAQGVDGIINSDSTLNLVGNFSGQELNLRWNFSGSWAESENIMHANVTIPSVYSDSTICDDVTLRLTTRVLTAHNQYTNITRERTIRACSTIPSHTACSDSEDNDHDGAIDYPSDFSCLNADDTSEDTPKAQCQDLKDNDGDGLIDLQDSGCLSSQDNNETTIVATPSPTSSAFPTPSPTASVEPSPSFSPSPIPTPTVSPSSDPSPAIIVTVSPSPSPSSDEDLPLPTIITEPIKKISTEVNKEIDKAVLSEGMIMEIDKAISSATGQQASVPVTAAATAVATTAAAVSVVNIAPSVAAASTQSLSSFGNFFFGIYFKRKKKSEHWVKVVDSITGRGIGGSMIQVRTIDGKVRTIWRTDDKTGNTGDLLPPGEYELVVTKEGWRFPSYIQPVFTKQKGDVIYRRGIIEVDQDGKINVKGDKNE